MKLPSRKTITASIFWGFIVIFLGSLFWYFVWPFLGTNTSAEYDDGSGERRGFTFFPFGRGLSETPQTQDPEEQTNNNNSEQNGGANTENIEEDLQRLRQITTVPTAGAIIFREDVENVSVFEQSAAAKNVIRYQEIESGHIYDTFAESLEVKRISNTTIPRVQELFWISETQPLIRYSDPASGRLRTFSANIVPRETIGNAQEDLFKLSGTFFQDDIKYITINSNKDIVYTSSVNGVFALIKTDAFGDAKDVIFSSPISDWKPEWKGRTSLISLTQYPSAVSYGISILLDATTKTTRPFISGKRGLDVLVSPNGTKSLVSYKTDEGISLFVRNENGSLTYTGFETYAEKCVWSSDNIFVYCAVPSDVIGKNVPDDWYMGLESYSDEFVRIKTDDNSSRELFSPYFEGGYFLDAIDMNLSADEKFLYFRDKENKFLWLYTLEL